MPLTRRPCISQNLYDSLERNKAHVLFILENAWSKEEREFCLPSPFLSRRLDGYTVESTRPKLPPGSDTIETTNLTLQNAAAGRGRRKEAYSATKTFSALDSE